MPSPHVNTIKSSCHVMIIAGEASGDQHGAEVVGEIKKICPHSTFSGMGSYALQKEGVNLLYDAAKLAVVGIFEVLAHLQDIRAARNILIQEMQDNRPDLLILIDFPDFNLSLAKKAKKLGIPVFYYISPQVWAWRSGRVKKIAALVDDIAVILPFEKDFYRQYGVDVNFVGHPLLDQVKPSVPPEIFRKQNEIAPQKKIIGILPGSRKKEVTTILPTFLDAARMLFKEDENLVFLLPLAPTLKVNDLHCPELTNNELPLKIIYEGRYDMMKSCDLVMAASGTVTLELAILNIPMVVAYRISPITYLLGRWLIKVKYASLVNLVAAKKIVKELIQDDFTAENIKNALVDIWPGTKENREMKKQLKDVCSQLGTPGASRRTAELALQLMSSRNHAPR